jgi:uncharacterized RDD family membrane protein YckC
MRGSFINSPFNVSIEFPLAGFGKRLLAWFIDTVFRIAIFLIASNIYDSVGENRSGSFLSRDQDGQMFWPIVLLVIPFLTYFLWQELLFNGRTFGKLIVGIKVISLDGYKARPAQIMNRWLFRLIDSAVITYFVINVVSQNSIVSFFINFLISLVAFIFFIKSSKEQRIGDIVADTIVVDLKKETQLADTLYVEVDDKYIPAYPQVTKLSDRDISIIKDILVQYYKNGNMELMYRVYEKVVNALQVKPNEYTPDLFFEKLLADYNYYTTREN